MVKAKQEAERLIEKFRTAHSEKLSDYTYIEYPTAKVLALICVEEMIDEYQSLSDLNSIIEQNGEIKSIVEMIVYWNEVKKQIEEL